MPHSTNRLVRIYFKVGLIPQIILGLILGIALAAISKDLALDMSFIGALFINALKSVAPILVLILVIASISNHQHGKRANMGELLTLYFSGMMLAALLATVASFIFPSVISLGDAADQSKLTPPGSIIEVLKTLFNKMIDNPVNALVNANYIGLIIWGVGIGIALRHSSAVSYTHLTLPTIA